MNNDLVRWLLDLERIPADAGPLRLTFENAWPVWVWALLAMIAAALAFHGYWRLTGRRGARGTLAAVRFALLLVVLLIISGPALELPRETVEPVGDVDRVAGGHDGESRHEDEQERVDVHGADEGHRQLVDAVGVLDLPSGCTGNHGLPQQLLRRTDAVAGISKF